jgi:cbb3-type cytochrome oxidase maturation protein
MTILLYLLAVSLGVACCGLALFLWLLRSGQYDDLDGAANRILFDDAITVAGLPVPDTQVRAVSVTRA